MKLWKNLLINSNDMRNYIKLLKLLALSLLLVVLFAPDTGAVPASNEYFELEQPDGTKISARNRGDEFYNWKETRDGYTVLRDTATRYWKYAKKDKNNNLIKSSLIAGKDDPKSNGLDKHLRDSKDKIKKIRGKKNLIYMVPGIGDDTQQSPAPGQSAQTQEAPAPALGTYKNLVLLCNFSDTTPIFTQANFDALFNQAGYSYDGASGSVRDYYQEVSYGNVDVVSTVTEWIQLSNTHDYYQSTGTMQELVGEALDILDNSGFDFSTMDGNGDGDIDGIDFIHQGRGEEESGDPSDIWSHAGGFNRVIDGVRIFKYHTEPELHTTGRITRRGIICHETGHFFGLWDLYDYDFSSQGIGRWGLMADSWGDNGYNPAHVCAFHRIKLGWATPLLIGYSQNNISLRAIEDYPDIIKVDYNMPAGQYILAENRRQIGSDASIPGNGMLMMLVDENMDKYGGNNDETHPCVRILQADGLWQLESDANGGDAGDPFPGTTVNRCLNESTDPSSDSYSGTTNIGICNISDAASVMTCDVTSDESGPPTKLICTANPLLIAADGASTALITVNVSSADDEPATYATNNISFSRSGTGSLIAPTSMAAVGGVATIALRSTTSLGTATVTATSTNLTQGTVAVVTTVGPAAKLVSTAADASLDADGTSTTLVTAQAYDAQDHLVTSNFGESVGWTGFSGGTGAWLYRKPITINSSSAQTNYQVEVTFAEAGTSALVSAGKMQSDYDDVRFTLSDGSTEITGMWVDSNCFVVKVPSIASGNTTIYMYYGNPAATAVSNGENTFEYFANFEACANGNNGACENMTPYSGTWTVVDGKYYQCASAMNILTRASAVSVSSYVAALRSKIISGTGNSVRLIFGVVDASNYWIWMIDNNVLMLRRIIGGVENNRWSESFYPGIGTWYELEVRVAGSTINCYFNDTLKYQHTGASGLTGSIGAGAHNTQGDFDDIRVSKNIASPPTVSSGAEQDNRLDPIITFSLSGPGTLVAPTAPVAVNGKATVTLRAATSAGTAIVTSTAENLSADSVQVEMIAVGPHINCSATPASIRADGNAISLITAGVHDSGDALIDTATNTIVFSMSGQGSLINPTSKAAVGGLATINMQSNTTVGTAVVTGTSTGLLQGMVQVNTTPNPVKIICTADITTIGVGGSSAFITAEICDSGDSLVNTTTNNITFGVVGAGSFVGGSVKAATNGIATVEFQSGTLAGTMTVTATSQEGAGLSSGNLDIETTPGTGTKLVNAANPGSIDADGTSTSLITAQASDQYDNPVTTMNGISGWSGLSNGSGAWLYRKPLTITSSSALSDYQVKIAFTAAGVAGLISGGKMQSNCQDVRFTLSDETTEVSYWLDSTFSDAKYFWLNIPSVANGSTVLYMYYGNPAANAVSDGDATFELFDDFEGTSLDTGKWQTWQVGTGTKNMSVSGGSLNLSAQGSEWTCSGIYTQSATNYSSLIIEVKNMWDMSATDDTNKEVRVTDAIPALQDSGDQYRFDYYHSASQDRYRFVKNVSDVGSEQATAVVVNVNPTNYEWERYVMYSGNQRSFRSTDGINYSSLWTTNENTILSLPRNLYIGYSVSEGYNVGAASAQLDWIRVRQYASNEPSAAVGTEEENIVNATITFSVTGPGTLLGETAPEAVDGVATVIMQSTGANGTVTVTSTAASLSQGSINVIAGGAPVAERIVTTAAAASILADGTDTTMIYAGIYDAGTTLQTDATNNITFSVSGAGTLVNPTMKAAVGGEATIVLQSTTSTGTATVTATSQEDTGLDQGTVQVTTTERQVKILCTTDNASILADGVANAIISARVCDSGNALVDTAANTLTFSVSGAGTLVNPTTKAASSGIATVELVSTTNTGTATVGATGTNLTQGQVQVTTTPRQVKILCTTNNASILADGIANAVITARVCDTGNAIVDTAVNPVTFSVSGEGTLVNPTAMAASAGIATVELVSTTNTGTPTVTATASGLSQGEVDIITLPRQVKIIATADRTSIASNGTSTALVTASICDTGDALVNTAVETVTFSISGDGTLLATTQKNAIAGKATVIMQSIDSQPGTASVTATATGLSRDNVDITTEPKVVDPPTGLTITAKTEHTLTLGWTAGTDNQYYLVERSENGVDYVMFSENYQGLTIIDEELRAGSTYYYKVYGYDSEDDSSIGVGINGMTTEVEEILVAGGGKVGTVGEIELDVPGDTFTEDAYIDINSAVETGAVDISLVKLADTARDIKAKTLFGTDITTFGKDVELKLYYTDEDLVGVLEESLKIYWLDESNNKWVKVGGTVDTDNKCVTTMLSHFSVYCVMGESSETELEIQNVASYPNPMNDETVFTFEINRSASVKLEVFTSAGKLVKRYEAVAKDAGYNEIPAGSSWDGTDDSNEALASGLYLYKLTAIPDEVGAKTITATGKLVIIK